MVASTFCPSASRMSPKTTFAPSRANVSASAAPCPRAPPLISATLPSNLPIVLSCSSSPWSWPAAARCVATWYRAMGEILDQLDPEQGRGARLDLQWAAPERRRQARALRDLRRGDAAGGEPARRLSGRLRAGRPGRGVGRRLLVARRDSLHPGAVRHLRLAPGGERDRHSHSPTARGDRRAGAAP